MRTYKQLTYEQRCQIEVLKKSSISQQEIAVLITVSQPSVSRELSRNMGLRGYRPNQAHRKAVEWKQLNRTKWRLNSSAKLKANSFWNGVRSRLVAGYLWIKTPVSHETINRDVWADWAAGDDLHKHLCRRARKYKSRGSNGKTRSGQIKNRVSIDEWPISVDEKRAVGDWEINTVIGKGHRGAPVTIVERVTLFTVSMRVKNKRAK